MTLLTYDEAAIVERLDAMDVRARVAFASYCAERLLPMFARYALAADRPQQMLRASAIVSATWNAADGDGSVSNRCQNDAEAMVPDEDDDPWFVEIGYAQHAAAAIAYAARTSLTGDAQEAGWAARQVYELADYAVLQIHPGLDFITAGTESAILESDLVQSALQGLERAIAFVARPSWTVPSLRDVAIRDGVEWSEGLAAAQDVKPAT